MLWPFSNIVEKSWIADAGLRAGVSEETRRIAANMAKRDSCYTRIDWGFSGLCGGH